MSHSSHPSGRRPKFTVTPTNSPRSSSIIDPRIKNLEGQRFDRLVVLRYAGSVHYGKKREGRHGSGRAAWECRCDCGNFVTVSGDALRKGNTRSCGCINREVQTARFQTHGKARTPEYAIWRAMKCRCTLPNYRTFKHYGGRGIAVCDRWNDSFENFLADMGPRPSAKHTLERKDNDGSYSPGNCAWVLRSDNQANRRCTINLTFQGETLPLNVWAERTGIQYTTLFYRLKRQGWTVERTLTTPTNRNKR